MSLGVCQQLVQIATQQQISHRQLAKIKMADTIFSPLMLVTSLGTRVHHGLSANVQPLQPAGPQGGKLGAPSANYQQWWRPLGYLNVRKRSGGLTGSDVGSSIFIFFQLPSSLSDSLLLRFFCLLGAFARHFFSGSTNPAQQDIHLEQSSGAKIHTLLGREAVAWPH